MKKNRLLKVCDLVRVILIVAGSVGSISAMAETFIVKDGQPQAEIVVSKDAPRMTKLAAEELQNYVEKISGAKLPIANAPGKDVPVQIYVGRSADTDKLKITDEGLKSGAFRMVSGKNYLVLLGHDSDFTPKGPWALHYGHIPRMMEEWDKLTGAKWDNPIGSSLFRSYSGVMKLWQSDQGGSLNAVYEYLRILGVRWYMPGPLGEILPDMNKNIHLTKIDRTVHPDYAMRAMDFALFCDSPPEDILWYLRLGLNKGEEVVGRGPFGHGTAAVHAREETKKAHPEYYALWGGKRITDQYQGKPCLSSEGLLQENIRYVRAVFDIYDEPMVSVMPEDGYIQACGCDLCKGKSTPERGKEGVISDYVWDYVNRVATEVYKTHPDRKIICFAYGNYTLPPEKIDKLSPNVVVGIVHGRGKNFTDPETKKKLLAMWEEWRKKTSNEMLDWEHYVFTHRGTFLPVYFPHAIAEGLGALKGISAGEYVETACGPYELRGHGLHTPGFNHLNIYVTSRFYWDSKQDVDALLDEYYRLFYGPAAAEMKAFTDYCEANYKDMDSNGEKIAKVFALLDAAQKKAEPKSAYALRMALVADYLRPLKNLGEQLAKGRDKDLPKIRAFECNKADIKMDGKLDDKFWKDVLVEHTLRDSESGAKPALKASFKVGWAADSLYFGIRCEDSDMKILDAAAAKSEGKNIWDGDSLVLLLETQSHSYYELTIKPDGTVVNADRKGGVNNTRWSSHAEAATYIGDGFWSMEVRVPIAGENAEGMDPLNGISGRKPIPTYPWYFNLCRQRVRVNETQRSALSPTGKSTFNDEMKFGKLFVW